MGGFNCAGGNAIDDAQETRIFTAVRGHMGNSGWFDGAYRRLGEILKDALLAAARALDRGEWDAARDRLRSAPLVRCERSECLVVIALWQHILLNSCNGGPPADNARHEILAALEDIRAAALSASNVWKAYQAIPVLEAQIGAMDTAAIVAATVWYPVLETHPALFGLVFELFFRAGGERCLDAWNNSCSNKEITSPAIGILCCLRKASREVITPILRRRRSDRCGPLSAMIWRRCSRSI
jgi:hypothetical protein